MKAWRIEKHGNAEVLQVKELPTVTAGPMQVRVKVEAVGLNHLDLWVRNGVPGYKFPLPLTPGCDIAGVIDQMGEGAEAALKQDGLVLGAPVLVSPGVSCGHCEACLGGFDPLCPKYGIIGETRDGGCADYFVAPVQNIIARPEEVSAIQAAAIPIPYLTAWTMLVRKAQIRSGETVLVQAGGSGVSVAAIQIAKMLGARVITTVGSDEKCERAIELGADEAINYKKTPFLPEVKKILSGWGKKGCDIVVDHVGTDTFKESLKALAWGGRLVTCGATSGSNIELDLKQIFFKNISILGTTMGSKADLIRIVQLVSQGKLHPVIDSVHPMHRYSEALSLLESRGVFGKVVVTA